MKPSLAQWASGSLTPPALKVHVGFGVAVRGSRELAEVPVHLSPHAKIREQNGATVPGEVQCQWVKGEDLASRLKDAALCTANTIFSHL